MLQEKTKYRVTVHKSGEYRYASTQLAHIDPITKKREYRHIHWGTLDENNRFYPNRRFIMADPAEVEKLDFPAEWDLSEIENVPQGDLREKPLYERRAETLHAKNALEKRTAALMEQSTISARGILRLIDKLEEEGVTDEKIVEIIRYVGGEDTD